MGKVISGTKFDIDEIDKSVLIVCSFYYPYVSGLTQVAVQLAEELASSGYKVSVLCHQHDATLKLFEVFNGVEVHRAQSLIKVNRAILSVNFFREYRKLAKRHRVINLHLPLPEAGFLKLFNFNNSILTYQCDLPRGKGIFRLFSHMMDLSSILAIGKSTHVVFSSQDYFDSSRISRFAQGKEIYIYPFCNSNESKSVKGIERTGRVFGYLGRFTSEKGALLLIEAFKASGRLTDKLFLAGSSKVSGDSVFGEVVAAALEDPRITVFPDLPKDKLEDFYSSLTVFCLPSLNSFEAFGIAQVEAILRDIPVLASDLPGVRVPVLASHMGKLIPPGEIESWKKAIDSFERTQYPDQTSLSTKIAFSKNRAMQEYKDLIREVSKI